MKNVIILIGPKGSGKTYIGRLIEEKFGIKLLVIENIFLKIQSEDITTIENLKIGYNLVAKEIDSSLKLNNSICFESTGLAPQFNYLLDRLNQKYSVHLISVNAPIDLCLKRINERDQTNHIDISEDIIIKINEMCKKLEFDYKLEIDNSFASRERLVKQLEDFILTLIR